MPKSNMLSLEVLTKTKEGLRLGEAKSLVASTSSSTSAASRTLPGQNVTTVLADTNLFGKRLSYLASYRPLLNKCLRLIVIV